MRIVLDAGYPARTTREVKATDLSRVYSEVSAAESPTFTWNDLGDQVLIVTAGDDYCTVSMLNESTWYYLEGSDSEELIEVDIEGQLTPLPKGVVLPRPVGLEVLQKADQFDRVLSDYSWREQ